MIAAHIILGIFCGVLAAGVVWFGLGGSVWWVIVAYCGAGSLACLASAGIAMVIAVFCPGRPEYPAEESEPDVRSPYA